MNVYRGCRVMRSIEIIALFSAFEADFEDGYTSVGEAHDFWELVYVKRGKVGVLAGDRIYNLEENMMILHPPMEFHRIWSEKDEVPAVIIISFAANWPRPPKNNVFSLNDESVMPEQVKNKITSAYDMSGRAVYRMKRDCEHKAQLAVAALEELMVSLSAREQSLQPERQEPSNYKYAEIVKTLENNKHKNLSLDEIADLCNMSVSNLKKIFQKYAGMGIKHYYNELKARQAVQYLTDGLSVKETAARLGFADQNYFSYFFKHILGKSPTEYMKDKKKSEN